jgi:hypothetical protein
LDFSLDAEFLVSSHKPGNLGTKNQGGYMRRPLKSMVVTAAIFAMTVPAPASAQQTKAAPVGVLAQQVRLPHQSFTLPNGLQVVVHQDRSAPIVAVAAWYNVGSKDEPKGKTGFAHLFEHIGLFNGTENFPRA